MKYPVPVICPVGSKVVVTQGFKPDIHEANDFVLWNTNYTTFENARLSYGAQFVCPWDTGVVRNVFNGETMNDRGNGLWIEHQKENGTWEACEFWHTSTNLKKDGDIVKKGDIVAYMGNTGLCNPMPTPNRPFDGTHCHFRYQTMNKTQWGNTDIKALDPNDYFDYTTPFTGEDSSIIIDAEPFKWGFVKKGLTTIWDKMMYVLKVLGIN